MHILNCWYPYHWVLLYSYYWFTIISVRWLHFRDSNNWNESTTTTTSSYSTEHTVITNSNSGLYTITRIVQPTSCIRRECVSSFLLAFYLCSQSAMLADIQEHPDVWRMSQSVTKKFLFWALHNHELQIIFLGLALLMQCKCQCLYVPASWTISSTIVNLPWASEDFNPGVSSPGSGSTSTTRTV